MYGSAQSLVTTLIGTQAAKSAGDDRRELLLPHNSDFNCAHEVLVRAYALSQEELSGYR